MRNAAPPPASVVHDKFDLRFPFGAGNSRPTQGAYLPRGIASIRPPREAAMSKELAISANRHETRVAIIEDDQVAEVYYQREHEYSLAGSIHKGRVTRVLPGMQSAFVDIGLDRDAFLYVSDFFEDNEEYDKIVTGVEDKVLKLDRTPQPPAPPAAVAEPGIEEAPPALPAADLVQPRTEAVPPAARRAPRGR